MSSEIILQQKKETVAQLVEKLRNASSGVLVNYSGINVANDTALRRELRQAGVHYAVVKNTILRHALDELGMEGLDHTLSGSTAVALGGEDAMAPAKILGKFAADSKGKFTIKAGFMEGQIMDEAQVIALSKLPGREGLLSMLVSALSGPIRGLAVALNAIVEKENGGNPGEVA